MADQQLVPFPSESQKDVFIKESQKNIEALFERVRKLTARKQVVEEKLVFYTSALEKARKEKAKYERTPVERPAKKAKVEGASVSPP